MRILDREVKKPDNAICADCPTRNPRWASINLGVFICITCSGIHRGLGVHISKVRSTNLDTWQPGQVEFMTKMGNKRANAYWEAKLPSGFRKPKEGKRRELEDYIKAKYARGKYADPNAVAPTVENCLAGKISLDAPAPAPAPAPAQKVAFSPKIPAQAPPAAAAPVSDDWADFSAAVTTTAAPAPAPAQDPFQVVSAPAPVAPAAAAPAPALVDPFAASAAPVASTSSPAPPVAPATDPFANSSGFDSLMSFESSAGAAGGAQQPPQVTKAVTDDIMSKFDEQPSMGQMGQMQGMGGRVPAMGGQMGGFQMPPQQQQQQQQFMQQQQQFQMQMQAQQQFQAAGQMPMGGMGMGMGGVPMSGMGMQGQGQPAFVQQGGMGMGAFQMPQQGYPQQNQAPQGGYVQYPTNGNTQQQPGMQFNYQ